MTTTAKAVPGPVPKGVGWRDVPRYRLICWSLAVVLRCYVRLRPEGLDRLPRAPYLVCFNHPNWLDPFVLLAVWPRSQRVFIFGPAEQDMSVGWKNRLMSWPSIPVSFRPGRDNLLDTARRVTRVLAAGHVLAIAGEGRLSDSENEIVPLQDGPAYFALRAQVPVVVVAINGTRWLRFGKTIRVRVGATIPTAGLRADRRNVDALTARLDAELRAMVRDYPDESPPGPIGRWVTDVFNDRPWLHGGEPPSATDEAR